MNRKSPDNTANHSGWLEISIDVNPSAREACSAFLFDLGCDGVVSEEFENCILKGYLPLETGFEELKEKLELFLKELVDFFPGIHTPELTLTKIKNQDWSTAWRSFFYLEQTMHQPLHP